jgi:GntR family transcriptional regulator
MELNSNSPVPLYVQLTEYLQHQIRSGVYSSGSKLPSERELADNFDVSRMTARKATQQLVQNGLASSQIGKGTFVCAAKINQELRELTSFTEEMGRRGSITNSRVLMARLEQANDSIAGHLNVAPKSQIIVLQRVRLADGRPLALETSHLNALRCPGILKEHDFSYQSLYHVLREVYGIRIMWANQWIEARSPNQYECDNLNVELHVPILDLTRVTFNDSDEPIEFVRSAYIGERYTLRTTLRMINDE